ncbi:cation:proton antiporter [Aromatoleum petrolei]|uniref:cation:proton antiporter domain-containing protein n=1 Tax=Aromatoleum petrolei TaxID=76116 RepID=UPI001BB75BBD|nr:cation:proton antiporter [Aromatoleum petrolei]QTQ35634.1 putative sodium/proton antiporter [Aromatoleum petrolei]
MDHDISLITTIAAAFGLALILGFVAERLKIPALVGYLVAGVAIGPASPGFVADIHTASQLSEIGVMLLMFGVGLHFSLDDLLAVRRIVVPGAVVQMAETARTLNPAIEIVLRTHSEADSRLLRSEGIGTVFYGEEELAKGMTGHVLERFTPHAAAQ